MLTIAYPATGDECLIQTGPVREAIVSWNTRELEGLIELRVNARDGRTSAWMPYVQFESTRRASLEGRDTFIRIDTDVLRSEVDIVSIGVRSHRDLDAVFVSTPDYGAPSGIVALPALELDVPPLSQYDAAYPDERGWCAPASIAMLLGYRSYQVDVRLVVSEVFDARYGGTGNWTFDAAFAARLGFRAAALHLRDLAHAHAFLADDIPLALSIAWEKNELPGAPLERSADTCSCSAASIQVATRSSTTPRNPAFARSIRAAPSNARGSRTAESQLPSRPRPWSRRCCISRTARNASVR